MTVASSAVSGALRPAAGSSRSRIDGATATARAIATSLRRPYGRSLTRSSRYSASSSSFTAATAVDENGGFVGRTTSVMYGRWLYPSEATMRFSRTVLASNSSSCWKERLTPCRARLNTGQSPIGSPLRRTVPCTGFTKPVIASISVVFPAPFGPIRPTTSPGATVTDASLTAVTPPKRTVMFDTSSVAGSTGSRATSGRDAAGRASGAGRLASRLSAPPSLFRSSALTLTAPSGCSTISAITVTPPITTSQLGLGFTNIGVPQPLSLPPCTA